MVSLITGINYVHKKLLIALLLILNYSLMFGVTEAAHIPDNEHPYGHAVDYDHSDELLEHSPDDGHEFHDEHHKHGAHVHLGFALPVSIDIDVELVDAVLTINHKLSYSNLTYSPPVPPPAR